MKSCTASLARPVHQWRVFPGGRQRRDTQAPPLRLTPPGMLPHVKVFDLVCVNLKILFLQFLNNKEKKKSSSCILSACSESPQGYERCAPHVRQKEIGFSDELCTFLSLLSNQTICIWGAGGATPGKFLLGLRVVTCDTSTLVRPNRVLVVPASNVSLSA